MKSELRAVILEEVVLKLNATIHSHPDSMLKGKLRHAEKIIASVQRAEIEIAKKQLIACDANHP